MTAFGLHSQLGLNLASRLRTVARFRVKSNRRKLETEELFAGTRPSFQGLVVRRAKLELRRRTCPFPLQGERRGRLAENKKTP